MKLPLLLAGAGVAAGLVLAYDSGVLTARTPAPPSEPLVRLARPIDGSGEVAAQLASPLAGLDEQAGIARLDLAVLDPVLPERMSGFAPDPLGGGLDPAMLVGAGAGHVGRAAPSGKAVPDGVRLVGWEDLLIPDYEPPSPFDEEEYTKEEIFPAAVLALHGLEVAVEGFMEPIAWKGDRVTHFLLSPYPPGCCFGGMPGYDEWIDVRTKDPRGVEYHAYRTVRVTGLFEVGEDFDDYGYLRSIFRLEAQRAENLW
jgi:hypothetical protein